MNGELPRPAPGHGGDRESSPIAAELGRRSDAAYQREEAADSEQQRLLLMPVRAFLLAMGTVLGMLAMLGLAALVSWVQGSGSHAGAAGKGIVAAAGVVGSLLIFTAVLLWRLPDHRPRSGSAAAPTGRITGYLLKNARSGAFGGPVNLTGGVPPFQMFFAWFWALLFSILVVWMGWLGWLVLGLNVVTLALLVDSWRNHRNSVGRRTKAPTQ